MNIKQIRRDYFNSLKSVDTEETIDLLIYRPIGYVWAVIAGKLGIHPNVITVASIFLGMGAGVMFYFNKFWMNLIGAVLLFWANSFDSADGQLARLTGQYSRLGRILDGLSGDLWFLVIYISICLREIHFTHYFGEHHWLIWVLAAVAGVSHIKQAAVADLYRQFHLYFIKGSGGSELENSFNLKRQLAETPRKKVWKRLTLLFYIGYTRQQEATTPDMQNFRRALNRHWPLGNYPEKLRTDFRVRSLPLMKYTNILTFNWRSIALLAAIFAKQPWAYFVFEITVMNVIMIYMIVRHERMCRYFTHAVDSGSYK